MQIPIHLFRSIQTWAFFVVILPAVLIYILIEVLRFYKSWGTSLNGQRMVGRIHDLQTRLKQFETQNSCGFTFIKSLNIETAKVCLMVLLQEWVFTRQPRSFLGDQESFLMRYDAVKVWILWSSGTNHFGRYNKGAGTDSTPICLTSFHPLLGPYLIHLCSAYSIYFILFLGRIVPTDVHPFIISQTDCH